MTEKATIERQSIAKTSELLFSPPQGAFESVDGELPRHDALEIGAADVVIQLRHFDIPVKDRSDRGKGRG